MVYKSLVIFGLAAFVFSTVAYFLSAQKKTSADAAPWVWAGRFSFFAGTVLISVIIAVLSWLIITHQFQYNYVYSYSSMDLPLDYLFSTLWAGQEGSFLLWLFFLSLLGLFLIQSAKDYEPQVMTVFSLAIAFLMTMIAGIYIGDVTIGSNPFKTIYEAFPGQVPEGFVPPDGRGLNPLLQNYWMTIHPPVLFTGFASALVPFAFAIAALWREKYDDWIRPALPWTIWAVFSLGTGIMMGGYWAYETLGWGGYWAWDPVENGSLVPWLALVAGIHAMLVQRKTGTLKRFTIFTAIFAFIMVVYSTFLTRSGVLADFSVHSFSSLGLFNQLLLFIFVFVLLGAGMMIYRWKRMPSPVYSKEIYSREFAMITGSLILTLMAIGVIFGTSYPLISGWFGEPKTIDPSGYNQLMLPVAVALALLMGTGQLLWFTKTDEKQVARQLSVPLILAILTGPVYYLLGVTHGGALLLAVAATFAILGNAFISIRIIAGNPKLAGGSLAHIGIGVMLIGFITSGKYDETTSHALPKGQPVELHGYTVTFEGEDKREDKEAYRLTVQKEEATWELKPIMYFSTYANAWMKSPDILIRPTYDLYISPVILEPSIADRDLTRLRLSRNTTIDLGIRKLTFTGFTPISMEPSDIRLRLNFRYTSPAGTDTMSTVYKVGANRVVSAIPLQPEPGMVLSIQGIDPEAGQVLASMVVPDKYLQEAPGETLVIEASIKPMIGLVWLGTLLTLSGFILSMVRRWKQRKLS